MGRSTAPSEAGAEAEGAGVKSRTIGRIAVSALLSLVFDLAGKSYGGRTFILAEPETAISTIATLFYLPHIFVAYAAYDPLRWLYLNVSRTVADLGVILVVLPISYVYVWAVATLAGRIRRFGSRESN